MPVRAAANEACTELLDPGRLALRCALWPDADEAGHRVEMAQLLAAGPQRRMQLVARALVVAVARRGRERGCTEFASDTPPDNTVGQAAHRALGVVETERVVYFRLPL